MSSPVSPERKIYSVSELNRKARGLLEGEFAQVWVEGEISNFVRAASGHWYFTLKDEGAQVRCAMFANRNRNLRFKAANGLHVILRGKASLYEGRGDYQLIAENLMQVGEGILQQRFDELKQKLNQEGLFAAESKQAIPALPKHIGVITSPTGAAVRDILSVLKRRFPAIQVSIIPTTVQGTEAAGQIVRALELAHELPANILPFDLLILGRGGGSLEDLWPFNEESVARAIFASKIPLVSAVGHEVDYTISDFVADLRAPTPSAAAELVTPDQQDWQGQLSGYAQYLHEALQHKLSLLRQQLTSLQKRLRHPGRQLQDQAQQLDYLEQRMTLAMRQLLQSRQAKTTQLATELKRHQPSHLIANMMLRNEQAQQRLRTAMKQTLKLRQNQLQSLAQALNTLSPLETLQRGYAIVVDREQQIVRHSKQLAVGDKVVAQLAQGKLYCSVDEVEE